jgi:hypothetical protein
MTATGLQLDATARARADAVTEAIRNRGRDTRHEHTREIVRTELPDDVRTMIIEMQGEISKHALQLIEIKMQLADVSAALRDAVARRVA